MPAVTNGLYRVVCEFLTGGGNPALNVFYYLSSLGQDDLAEDLWDAFDTTMVPLINALHYPAYTFDNLIVEPIFGSGIPFESAPTNQAGTLLLQGDPVAGHMCVSMRLVRASKETRSGWKRFSGFSEHYVSGNTVQGDLATALNALATSMETDLTAVGAGFFTPVLVRPPGTYATGVQTGWLYNNIGAFNPILNRVTTQNSRKKWQ